LGVSLLNLPILAALVAILSAALGVLLLRERKAARFLIPLSGGLLAGVALFGLIPELTAQIGWATGLSLVALGYGLLMGLDRFVYSVCPSCAHDHDHEGCATTLHGFAAPILIATSLHAFIDGWGLVTVQSAGPALMAGTAFVAALFLHKVPEGLALGTILRASLNRGGSALYAIILCAVAEMATVVGGGAGLWRTPAAWVGYPLAVAGGTFLFLGVHAVHSDWKRRGARTAFIPALAGAAGAVILQQGLRLAVR
jgi:zinc transporter ZupT